ncbi:hypothetical protein EIN_227280 [Entamoeba invadens IP1]|uniref:Uncharacterized protein n=1 Tax=Entamoeba invadens IP1 TaxID=370355 RepID=A0A0A1U608_ENTIV|nr:hypothetical protein EIN_227280 [Entamoeba invadens IP1]ELP88315.1 hypothetical protein EIN_227280 [Entamoeba invadens IP1]|eukprot:XP_004255086.1 hypothetical protein EIN_227280 [Entamoeba invadens IP1]
MFNSGLNERSSFNLENSEELRKMVLKEVRLRTKVLQSSEKMKTTKCGGYCSVLIGDEVPGKLTVSTLPPMTDQFMSIEYMLNLVEIFLDDSEVVNSVIYCVAIMVLDTNNRVVFQQKNGLMTVQKAVEKYKQNIVVLRCCCSVFANVGPYIIDLPSITLVEEMSKLHPYDQFIKTALCAAFANYARVNPTSVIENGIIEKMKPLLCDSNIDLQYSVLAAYSNIARNSTIGQKRCIDNGIHEVVMNKLLRTECNPQYWRVACNTLGCFAVNGLGFESVKVVKYAIESGFVDKIIDVLHIVSFKDSDEKGYERMYGCLAKFAIVRAIKRIPRLSWLSFQCCKNPRLIPAAFAKFYLNDAFKCHVCKKPCDPLIIRSIKFQDKLVLMSYCSTTCWGRRHEC